MVYDIDVDEYDNRLHVHFVIIISCGFRNECSNNP